MCLTEPPLPRDLRLVCAGIRVRSRGGARGRPVVSALRWPLPSASEVGGKPERHPAREGLPAAPWEGRGDQTHPAARQGAPRMPSAVTRMLPAPLDGSVNNVAFYKSERRTRFLNFLPGSGFRTALASSRGLGKQPARCLWSPQPHLAPAFGTRLAAQTSSQCQRCGGSAASPGPGSGTGSSGCARSAPLLRDLVLPWPPSAQCPPEEGVPSCCPQPVGCPAPSVPAAGEPGSAGGLQPRSTCKGLSYSPFAWGMVSPTQSFPEQCLRPTSVAFFFFFPRPFKFSFNLDLSKKIL